MKRVLVPLIAAVTVTSVCAQPRAVPRLALERLNVTAPSERVRGEPGNLTIERHPCRDVPGRDLRRQIVDVAVQEWAFFGFSVLDETDPANWVRRRPWAGAGLDGMRFDARRVYSRERVNEAARVAASIAGYWAVTPEGAWIVSRQNEAWNATGGRAVRWVEPWSAAFVSWVMCESGLTQTSEFRHAIAHHAYIDQAIRARDGTAPEAAFVAYDVGETDIVPGDLLCLARRPAYRTLAERRAQMGMGARTHCDVVVKVDEQREVLLAIGGNVRGTVGLKLLPAERVDGRPLRPLDRSSVNGARSAFAHLKLRADPIEAHAFDTSATLASLACELQSWMPEQVVAASVVVSPSADGRC